MDSGRLLLALDLLEVELEFLTLKDVTVATARLTGTAGDEGQETASGELVINMGIDLGELLAALKLTEDAAGLLLLGLLGSLGTLTLTKSLTVVGLVPLTEGSGINLNDGRLDKSLGTDELVVAGIVDNINDTGLAADGLASPGEVARVKTEGTLLDVTTTDADGVDTLGTELGVGCLTAEIELSLLAVESTLGTGGRSLVAAITTNTYRGVSIQILKRENRGKKEPVLFSLFMRHSVCPQRST